ncbi:hypothetical protein [Zhongshania arctica]|uniref:Uncharacterized protein n=1 Tax=Zhongshania arctica TaxID=3238302 RepID=A0ABV3TS46_9GAMM
MGNSELIITAGIRCAHMDTRSVSGMTAGFIELCSKLLHACHRPLF